MPGRITITMANVQITFDRDLLATACLLRMEHPEAARTQVEVLKGQFGVDHHEAMRLVIGARFCEEQGIDP